MGLRRKSRRGRSGEGMSMVGGAHAEGMPVSSSITPLGGSLCDSRGLG